MTTELVTRLREELQKRAFHHGTWAAFSHIEYCDFCNFSREWVAKHGHEKTCLLYVPPVDATVPISTNGDST